MSYDGRWPTREENLAAIRHALTGIDLGDIMADATSVPALKRIEGIDRIEFMIGGETGPVVTIDGDRNIPVIGLRRAVAALAQAVAGRADRHIGSAAFEDAGRRGTLRIRLRLTPTPPTPPQSEKAVAITDRSEMARIVEEMIG